MLGADADKLKNREDMNLKEIALDWIDAWNKKDIDRIMSHYSEDIIFFAPTVIKRWKAQLNLKRWYLHNNKCAIVSPISRRRCYIPPMSI
jgi:ketosteroid isomerase-like protein